MSALRITRLCALLAMAVGAASVVPAPPLAAATSGPDQVLVWNQIAYDELVVGKGPFSVQHLAMVHGAVYDAVNAIDGGYQPYLVAPPAEATYSKGAAAAAAAHDVLVSLLPAREGQLDAYYDDSLAMIPDVRMSRGGSTWGRLRPRR